RLPRVLRTCGPTGAHCGDGPASAMLEARAPERRPHTLRATVRGSSLPDGRRVTTLSPGRSCAPSPTGPAAQLATRCAAGLPPLPTRDTTGRLRMAKGNVAQARTAGGNVTTAEPEFVQLLT